MQRAIDPHLPFPAQAGGLHGPVVDQVAHPPPSAKSRGDDRRPAERGHDRSAVPPPRDQVGHDQHDRKPQGGPLGEKGEAEQHTGGHSGADPHIARDHAGYLGKKQVLEFSSSDNDKLAMRHLSGKFETNEFALWFASDFNMPSVPDIA